MVTLPAPGLIRAHSDLRRLWIGDGISKLGSSIAILALPTTAAIELDASTWEVALLTAFAGLPWLVIALPAGAWVDRLRRRPILITADLVRALVLASVPVAAFFHVLTLQQLYVVEIVIATGTVFFDVSLGSYVPALVGREHLVAANGHLETNRTVAATTGPAFSGQLIQWAGAPFALIGTALGFLWSAAWIASIRQRESVQSADARNLRTRS